MDRRVFFGREFRKYRLAAHCSQADVARESAYTVQQISMVESGKRSPSDHLGRTADRMFALNGTLEALAGQTREEVNRFIDFVEQEQQSTRIRTYDLRLVPGLLQTEDYARWVIRGSAIGGIDVDAEVELRMKRQGVLERIHLRTVIDESVLYRSVAPPDVMRRQLTHLLEPGDRIAIHILPMCADANPSLAGPMTLLHFTSAPTVVLADGRVHGELIDAPDAVAELETAYDAIVGAALPEAVSADMIATVLEEL